MKKLLLFIFVIFVSQLRSQCFNAASLLPINGAFNHTAPYAVIGADFNKDGIIDLAIGHSNGGGTILVHLGNGNGTFGPSSQYSICATGKPSALTSADFNGDGNLDIAAIDANGATGTTNTGYVLLGNGTGGFGAPISFLEIVFYTSPEAHSITSADFNGDGKLDLALAISTRGSITVLLGDGTGHFATPVEYMGAGGECVISADFNNDGKMDLAGNGASVLLGNGNGTFGAAISYGSGTSIATADFNGDGKLDLATTGGTSATASVLLGNGTGGFGTPASFAIANWAYSITTADFNADGKLDIATTNGYANTSNSISILIGNGAGSFAAPVNFNSGARPYGIFAGDFNGDSKPDIAATNSYSANVSILLNAPLPSVAANSTSDSVCAGTSVTLTGSGTCTSYVWTGGVVDVTAFTPNITNTYTVTGTDAGGV